MTYHRQSTDVGRNWAEPIDSIKRHVISGETISSTGGVVNRIGCLHSVRAGSQNPVVCLVRAWCFNPQQHRPAAEKVPIQHILVRAFCAQEVHADAVTASEAGYRQRIDVPEA